MLVRVSIGSGLTYTASVVVIGLNFEKKRNLAAGIAVSGTGIGTMVFAPVLKLIQTTYGYEGLFILSSGLALQSCIAGALCRPSQIENKRKHDLHKQNLVRCSFLSSNIKLFRNIPFLCMCVSVLCWSTGVYMAYLHLPYYVTTLNTTPIQVAWIISAAGVGGFSSRVLSGLASNNDDIDDMLIYSGSFGVLGICTIFFPLYAVTFTGQIFYGVALGIYSGSCYAVMNSINISIVGINSLDSAFGIEMFSRIF
ncbi:hypothetical protein KUTeg_005613 [Tegillarca granosa]|uniref:Monocarboxylate transporter 12 n=1 Tax=Tegillarca granosa TaxID=220873 RepID=A0ABQ9FKA1_TEGGR|nr:hypothetical protein KUTeg_005613 [Tegillarca granosa]